MIRGNTQNERVGRSRSHSLSELTDKKSLEYDISHTRNNYFNSVIGLEVTFLKEKVVKPLEYILPIENLSLQNAKSNSKIIYELGKPVRYEFFNDRSKSGEYAKRDWIRPELLESGNNPNLKERDFSYMLKKENQIERTYFYSAKTICDEHGIPQKGRMFLNEYPNGDKNKLKLFPLFDGTFKEGLPYVGDIFLNEYQQISVTMTWDESGNYTCDTAIVSPFLQDIFGVEQFFTMTSLAHFISDTTEKKRFIGLTPTGLYSAFLGDFSYTEEIEPEIKFGLECDFLNGKHFLGKSKNRDMELGIFICDSGRIFRIGHFGENRLLIDGFYDDNNDIIFQISTKTNLTPTFKDFNILIKSMDKAMLRSLMEQINSVLIEFNVMKLFHEGIKKETYLPIENNLQIMKKIFSQVQEKIFKNTSISCNKLTPPI